MSRSLFFTCSGPHRYLHSFPYTTLFRSIPVFLYPLPRPISILRPIRLSMAESSFLRSEEHTSELQSHSDLVCRLLLEKKKNKCKLTSCHTNHHTRTLNGRDRCGCECLA